MTENEQPTTKGPGNASAPPESASPYDESTGQIPIPASQDKDDFYDRHVRGRSMSRVDDLDDLDPGDVETKDFGASRPRPRNPAPLAPTPAPTPTPAPDDSPTVAGPMVVGAAAGKESGSDAVDRADQPTEVLPTGNRAATGATPRAPYTAPAEVAATRAEPVRVPAEAHREVADEGTTRPLPTPDATATSAYDADTAGELDHGELDADDVAAEPAASERAPESTSEVAAQPPPAGRGTLDLGLLLLRVAVGAVAMAHGLQKLFGLWGGPRLSGFEAMLLNSANTNLGFNPDYVKPLAIVGVLSETIGGLMLIVGLLTPIGGSAVLGVMLVASAYKATLAGGFSFFAAGGGVEYELLLAVAAAAIILTGPGLYSLDNPRGWARRPFLGSVLWLVIGVAGACVIWVLCNGNNPFVAAPT